MQNKISKIQMIESLKNTKEEKKLELKTRYQYTYFIHPFIVEDNKYSKYILKLLKDKNCSLKIFEKERDLDIYTYFLPSIRKYLFPSFDLTKDKIKSLRQMKLEAQSTILSNYPCVSFLYTLGNNVQGKIGTENGIFFNMEKIEIMCFHTGICFLIMKTIIDENSSFSDVLNFNYKFKDINSEFTNLKSFENIKIQTSTFKDMKELSEIIQKITGINKKSDTAIKRDVNNSRFYTHSYLCIDSDKWNEKNHFETIENDFYKYVNVTPNQYSSDFNKECNEQNLQIISKLKYARIGLTKLSSNLMCSVIDTYNYTKLPFEYENEFLYTYILRLYQKIFLIELNSDFKIYDRIPKMREKFIQFTKQAWMNEITTDDMGTLYYSKLGETLELDNLYEEIKTKYEVIYKELNIEKNNHYYAIIVILLIISLAFNTFNIIALMYMSR